MSSQDKKAANGAGEFYLHHYRNPVGNFSEILFFAEAYAEYLMAERDETIQKLRSALRMFDEAYVKLQSRAGLEG